MGGGKPKQVGFETTTSKMGLPPWLDTGMQNMAGNALDMTNYTTFQPFSGNTQAGMQGIQGMAMDPNSIPGRNAAFAQHEGTLNGDYLYGGDAFNAAQQAAANRITPQVTSAFNSANRMGGVAGSGELTRQLGDSFAGLYNQERGRQMSAMSMAPQMQQMAYDPYARLMGIGGMEEAKNRELAQDMPNRYDRYLNTLGQIAPFYGEQTNQRPMYKQSGGGFGQLLGAGMSLAGMATGNPFMGMAGKGLGLLGVGGGTTTGPGGYIQDFGY